MFKPFIAEFLKWTLPSLNIVRTIVPHTALTQKSKVANSADPDVMPNYEPFHPCALFVNQLFWSTGLKWLTVDHCYYINALMTSKTINQPPTHK